MQTQTSDRHRGPRNRARQRAARDLAAKDNLTYQQALQSLSDDARAWSAQIELTFVVDRTLDDLDPHASASVVEAPLARNVTRANQLLAGRGTLRVIDLLDADTLPFECEQGCGRETADGCGQPDCPHAGETFEPDVVLGFRAANRQEAVQILEGLLDVLDGGFDDAVTFDRDDRQPPEPVGAFNTRLTWRYRDANNYKATRCVVLEGEPTPETMAALRSGLFEGTGFIPSQVGLPNLQGDLQAYDSEKSRREYRRHADLDPDHPWHEIEPRIGEHVELTADPPSRIEPTDAFPGASLGFDELTRRIRDAIWDDTIPVQ